MTSGALVGSGFFIFPKGFSPGILLGRDEWREGPSGRAPGLRACSFAKASPEPKRCSFRMAILFLKDALETFRRVALLLGLCLWFGGFTFYALVVIHVGHRVFRGRLEVGFLTQAVTHWLNLIGGAVLV